MLVTAAILLAQEQQEVQLDPAEEGLKVITWMLIVGLIFISVIALGQFANWASHRREARRPRPY